MSRRVWMSISIWGALLCVVALNPAAPAPARGDAQTAALDSCRTIETAGAFRLVSDISSKGDCIKIRAGNVTLDCGGRQIKGINYIGKGIKIEAADPQVRPANIEIQHCRISDFLYGIEIQNGQGIRIHDNDLSGNFDDTNGSYHGAWLGLVDGGGVRVNRGTDITLEANVANRGANGMDVRDSAQVVIRGNTTNRNSAFGIVLTNTTDSLVEGNIVGDNVRWCTFPSERGDVVVPGCDSAGIMLQDGSGRNRVRGNTVSGQNGDGIFVRNHTGRCGDDTVIEENKIVGAVWNGIEAGFCDRILISGNEFSSSKFGVWISYMDGVTLVNNSFMLMEQAGLALKNTHSAQIKHNSFSQSAEGIMLFGNTDDEKFGWTMRHPFSYYRSYANVVTGNTFSDVTGSAIRLENSTGNVISGNAFGSVGKAVTEPDLQK